MEQSKFQKMELEIPQTADTESGPDSLHLGVKPHQFLNQVQDDLGTHRTTPKIPNPHNPQIP